MNDYKVMCDFVGSGVGVATLSSERKLGRVVKKLQPTRLNDQSHRSHII